MKSSLLKNREKQTSAYLFVGLLGTLLSLFIQSHPTLDYWIQNFFYDVSLNRWWIQESTLSRMLMYTLPKLSLILLSVVLIIRQLRKNDPHRGRKAIVFLLCMSVIPLVISFLKAKTNIHCPNDLIDYRGRVPFRSIFDLNTYKKFLSLYGNGNCFPGGHASGGYALMSMYFVLDDKNKRKGIVFGFFLGSYMGIYQMIKGAHFFSHTLFTLGFSVTVICFFDLWYHRKFSGNFEE